MMLNAVTVKVIAVPVPSVTQGTREYLGSENFGVMRLDVFFQPGLVLVSLAAVFTYFREEKLAQFPGWEA